MNNNKYNYFFEKHYLNSGNKKSMKQLKIEYM